MSSSLRPLAVLCAVSACCYLTMGIAFGTIPGFVQHTLGYGPLPVGIAIGVESLGTILTRAFAGHFVDHYGAKPALMLGIFTTGISGIVSLVAGTVTTPVVAFAVLIVARIVLGFGESYSMTGALSWGVGALDPQRSGAVMVWVGIALYAALGIGASIGAAVSVPFGFSGAAALGAVLALIGLVLASTLKPTPVPAGTRTPFGGVIRSVLPSGIGLAISVMGFSAISAFITLLFEHRGWSNAPETLAVFAVAFILARFAFGTFPDRFGGRYVGAAFLLAETAGMLLLSFAAAPVVAFLGAAFVGAGYSIVFPALGVEAVRNVPAQSRGSALGAFTMFFDAGLAVMGPVNGWIAAHAGIDAVYLVGACGPALGAVIVLVCVPPDARSKPATVAN
jgi:MFS family permease